MAAKQTQGLNKETQGSLEGAGSIYNQLDTLSGDDLLSFSISLKNPLPFNGDPVGAIC